MEIGKTIIIIYLIAINIFTLIQYLIWGKYSRSKSSTLMLIILPIIGGGIGACLGNYFRDTEYTQRYWWASKPIAIFSSISMIVSILFIFNIFGIEDIIKAIWIKAYAVFGILGYYLVIINLLTFIFIGIRKFSYYFLPSTNDGISRNLLIPALILGGSIGGVIAKITFNFKEDWDCVVSRKIDNFLYNNGMFLLLFIHLILLVCFVRLYPSLSLVFLYASLLKH